MIWGYWMCTFLSCAQGQYGKKKRLFAGRDTYHWKGNKCNQLAGSCTTNRLSTTLLSLLLAMIKRAELKITASKKCEGKHPLSTVAKSNQWFFTKNNYCLPLPDRRQNFWSAVPFYFPMGFFIRNMSFVPRHGLWFMWGKIMQTHSQKSLKSLQFTLCLIYGGKTFMVKGFLKVLWLDYMIYCGLDMNTTV